MSKKVDVVVWGATGFTGELTAIYLAKRNLLRASDGKEARVSFAIGGRTEAKLLALKERLIQINPDCKDVTVIVADVNDAKSMDAMVSTGRAVCACAGPFTLTGSAVTSACVRNGVHYCDITGETPWVKSVLDTQHDAAKEKGIALVPLCGFDSVPSDIGVLYTVDQLRQLKNEETASVTSFFNLRGGGGASGGTSATMLLLSETPGAKDKLLDPYLLNPANAKPATVRPGEKDFLLPGYNSDVQSWYAPFIMAAANTRVVRRSAALLNYSRNFAYTETMKASNVVVASLVSFVVLIANLLLAFSFTRGLIKRIVPKPGDGPNQKVRSSASFEARFVGKGVNGSTIITRMSGPEAYEATAVFAAEGAVQLAQQGTKQAGVVTPAAALGTEFVERLKLAHMPMKFEVLKN